MIKHFVYNNNTSYYMITLKHESSSWYLDILLCVLIFYCADCVGEWGIYIWKIINTYVNNNWNHIKLKVPSHISFEQWTREILMEDEI